MTNQWQRNKCNCEDAYRVFFQALTYRSPHKVIEAASKFFGMPVILTDRHYRLISLYPDRNINEYIYDTLREKHVLPEGVTESYQKMYLENSGPTYEPMYEDEGLVGDCPRIFAEVYDGDQIYGHFAIMMFEQPLQENDLECAVILKDALKIVMTSRNVIGSAGADTYLLDLLNPSTSDALRQFAVNTIQQSLKGNYALMVTKISPTAGGQAFAAMRTTEITNRFYGAISTIYANCLVTLFGSVKASNEQYRKEEKTVLEKSAEQLKFAGPSGISLPFTNLDTLAERFQEASLAASFGNERLAYFSEIMPDPLFISICTKINPSIFIHPALEKIKNYDQENCTAYFETLRSYSLNMHNNERTAKQLHIHRNTLHYRLKRIHEIFNIDVKEQKMALVLLNSFQVWDSLPQQRNNSLCFDN